MARRVTERLSRVRLRTRTSYPEADPDVAKDEKCTVGATADEGRCERCALRDREGVDETVVHRDEQP
jgi:hypothetical protein